MTLALTLTVYVQDQLCSNDHLFGELLFTWLSLVESMAMSFCAVLFPVGCLGWDLELNWVGFWGFSFLLLGHYAFMWKMLKIDF